MLSSKLINSPETTTSTNSKHIELKFNLNDSVVTTPKQGQINKPNKITSGRSICLKDLIQENSPANSNSQE